MRTVFDGEAIDPGNHVAAPPISVLHIPEYSNILLLTQCVTLFSYVAVQR